MTDTQTYLQQAFPTLSWQFDKPLATMTYFKIGGPAEAYLESADIAQVSQVLQACHQAQIPVTILGGASNVIVSDEGIRGVVIHLLNDQVTQLHEDGQEFTHVLIGAGCKTALAVSQTVSLGLTGLEYFLGVPGTIGGATYNNAHYLSHLMADHIVAVEVLTPEGQDLWLEHHQCEFGYDTSRFQRTKEIIVNVEFGLVPGDIETSQQLIKEATEYRARTQPLGQPSSGCIFQNTPNTPELQQRFPQFAEKEYVPGGFLIDQAGLKNLSVGGVRVSDKHAAFFVNTGGGTSQDVLELITQVKHRVRTAFGVELQEEVFFLH